MSFLLRFSLQNGMKSVQPTKRANKQLKMWRQKEERDWFLYSIIVLLLHRCRTHSLTMDARTQSAHSPGVHVVLPIQIQPNKTNRTKKQQLKKSMKEEQKFTKNFCCRFFVINTLQIKMDGHSVRFLTKKKHKMPNRHDKRQWHKNESMTIAICRIVCVRLYFSHLCDKFDKMNNIQVKEKMMNLEKINSTTSEWLLQEKRAN